MFTNKKTIIGIAVLLVILGIAVQKLTEHTPTADLPVVSKNTTPSTTAAPTVTPEPFVADAPADGIDVSGVKDAEIPADTAAAEEYQQKNSPVQSDKDIAAAVDEAKRTEDAIKNPQPQSDPVKGADEGVKVVPPKTESPPAPTPKADADGYIYTKEQAIAAGTTALQHEIDTNSFAWADAYKSMKEDLGYTDEFIQTLVLKAKNAPYSSTVLTKYYDSFRRDGDKLYLAESIIAWIVNGGNDDGYSGHGV